MQNLSRYIVDAVVLEARSYREVARALGVSKSLVAKLVGRFRAGGYEAITPRSTAPRRTPHKTSDALERRIVELRKQLTDAGFDAGARTIWVWLARERDDVPSVSSIWRVLRRRGFVVPQPHKRPRSSWKTFEAHLPNGCWQTDVTYWFLADGTRVEILSFLDDFSRLCVSSRAFAAVRSSDVIAVLGAAATQLGEPAAILSDNGLVFTGWPVGGTTVFELELAARGIEFKHARPAHPQTCGKIERWHQTLKRFLAAHEAPADIAELQALLDRFVAFYNTERPNQAKGRITPAAAYALRDKARPDPARLALRPGQRIRDDRVDPNGKVSLRHAGRMHHIRVGYQHRGTRVRMLIDGLHIRIVHLGTGELLRELILDPTKLYHGTGRPPGPLR